MNALTAHGHFAQRHEAGENFATRLPDIDFPADIAPAVLTAAASLSGALEDCASDLDLDAAVVHFLALFDAGIVTLEQLQAEIAEVFETVAAWAETAALSN